MKMTSRWTSAAVFVTASLLLTSCERAGDITQPLASESPSLAKGGKTGQLRLVQTLQTSGTAEPIEHFDLIGPAGGPLGNHDYGLSVPRGAVATPTLFVIRARLPEYSSNLVLEASATSCDLPTAVACHKALQDGELDRNDVGEGGFRVPVTLAIGFDPGGSAKSWQGVTMVLVEGETLVAIPTKIMMAQKQVRGLADHFSLYGLAWP